jgi:adenine-specific DNA-methyltransferase
MARRTPSRAGKKAETYRHEDEALLRPDVGTQAQFRKKKPPKTYRYDSSLSPALDWDGQNPGRELGEWLLEQIDEASHLDPPHRFAESRRFGDVEVVGLADAIDRLKALSTSFLDWTGKAERLSFDVPTLPLFVHERLSTKAILETLKGHERDRQMEMQLFGDPELPLHQQLEAYEHRGGWVNRMILGDSLVVMNSLLEYEGLGGQVQLIYVDPPYGVRFGSNFQPFVRKRDVKSNDDADMTREPEMVKAYRDTWDLGLHSYLTYLRDRLLVARELLTPSGSVFVQIGEENVHHVRELLDEVFGTENFVAHVVFTTTTSEKTTTIAGISDHLLWYAREADTLKFRPIYLDKVLGGEGGTKYNLAELEDGTVVLRSQVEDAESARIFRLDTLTSQRPGGRYDVMFKDKVYRPEPGYWKPSEEGMARLIAAGRVRLEGKRLAYVRYFSDFPVYRITNVWDDLSGIQSRSDGKIYAVQTPTKLIERAMLMATDPGDLVLDPTCGSGTTAYVAEQWGRRWITIDTSRVPLALTRQRLITATFPYYELQDEQRGPAGGFVYKRRQNAKGEDVGGIVPHVTLKSIANDEPAPEEVLVDRPAVESRITRVSGPFVVEATIPTPVDYEGDGIEDSGTPVDAGYVDRMLEALRRNPVLRLGGSTTIELADVRSPAVALTLTAEATLDGQGATVAIVFGPENGAVSEKLVYEAAREAHLRNYAQLIVIGFAIEPQARILVDNIEHSVGIGATYVQATPDLVMG